MFNWDEFVCAVHDSRNSSTARTFSYLCANLKGPALHAVVDHKYITS